MKKKQLETLEKINEERKLDKETKRKILKKVLKNFLFATGILFLFIILNLIAINLEKKLAILIYKVLSIVTLMFTLVLFEIAYKKNNDNIAITSIEIFFVSIAILLAPYTLIVKNNISIIGIYFALYYVIKNGVIYRNSKKEYLNKKNDINEIIKKESQDKLAQKQLEKTKEKVEKEEISKKSGRGRPKKTTSEVTKIAKTTKTATKKTAKTTEKIQEKPTEEQPKRKRGRPRKIVNS